MIDPALIDEIRERNNIVEVIGGYIPLKRAGSNFKARCPFHEEKTASFNVNEKKQIYKCFGCGRGGNVFTFIQEYEKVNFIEAVKRLAQRVGIQIEDSHQPSDEPSKRDLLLQIYRQALDFFVSHMKEHGEIARGYLKERGLTDEIIEKYEIGLAPNSFNALKDHLLRRKFDTKLLRASGLFAASQRGEHFDYFRNRIIFPIHNILGKVVAFGGRVMPEDPSNAKYINSPETDLYTKGDELFGLYQTRYDASKKKQIILCEGYTDFLRMASCGVPNAAASLGTALTEKQISLAGRYTGHFVMLYDGDKAGRKASLRAAVEIHKRGFTARIASLPDDEDPDTFLIHHDVEELTKIVEDAVPMSSFLKDNQSLGMEEREKIDLLIEVLGNIEDPVARELQARDFGEVFGITTGALMSRIRSNRPKRDHTAAEGPDLKRYSEERVLLKMMLSEHDLCEKVCEEVDPDYFFTYEYRYIFDKLCTCVIEMKKTESIFEMIDKEEIRNMLSEMMMEETPDVPVEEITAQLLTRKHMRELKSLEEKISKDIDNNELIQKKEKIKNRIRQLGKGVVFRTPFD